MLNYGHRLNRVSAEVAQLAEAFAPDDLPVWDAATIAWHVENWRQIATWEPPAELPEGIPQWAVDDNLTYARACAAAAARFDGEVAGGRHPSDAAHRANDQLFAALAPIDAAMLERYRASRAGTADPSVDHDALAPLYEGPVQRSILCWKTSVEWRPLEGEPRRYVFSVVNPDSAEAAANEAAVAAFDRGIDAGQDWRAAFDAAVAVREHMLAPLRGAGQGRVSVYRVQGPPDVRPDPPAPPVAAIPLPDAPAPVPAPVASIIPEPVIEATRTSVPIPRGEKPKPCRACRRVGHGSCLNCGSCAPPRHVVPTGYCSRQCATEAGEYVPPLALVSKRQHYIFPADDDDDF